MGIKLIGPAPQGTRSYKQGPLAGLAEAFASGFEGFQQGRKLREASDESTIKKLLLRGELSGTLGTIGERERGALKRYGFDEASIGKIQPTEVGRKAHGIKTAAESLGVNLDQAQMERMYLKSMGIDVKTPEEERDQLNKELKSWDEQRKRLGIPEATPPTTLITQYEKHYGPWPTETVPDPVTGVEAQRKVPYRGQDDLTPEKLVARIQSAVNTADLTSADPRTFVEGQMAFLLGAQWRQTRPEVGQLVEQTLSAMGHARKPLTQDSVTTLTSPGRAISGTTKSGVRFRTVD